MALAHEPDLDGLAREYEPLVVPRWSETPSLTFTSMTQPGQVVLLPLDQPVSRRQWLETRQIAEAATRPAARSIYDMPINPLPVNSLPASTVQHGYAQPRRQDAVVLQFVRPGAEVARTSPIDYRPLWIAGAFLAASLCVAATIAAPWFQVAPAQATSTLQRIASTTNALVGITGIASLAAVVSTALLIIGAQRTR